MVIKSRFGKALTRARSVTERHGGGWSGLRSIITHSFKSIQILGLRGLLQRLSVTPPYKAAATVAYNPAGFALPTPIANVTLKVGVMAHVFYPDLIEEFAQAFVHMPLPYTLMVSVLDEDAKSAAVKRFSSLPKLLQLHVRIVPNRGRNIAPMLLTFREEVLAQDILCHLHTKKSFHGGQEQSGWRRYLVESLFGSRSRLAWILGTFDATPALGVAYPESYATVPLLCHTWLSNVDGAQELAQRMGFDINAASYLDFPAGSMFWARTSALRPLFDLGLTLESFPPEHGQLDGALQHVIERMFGVIVRQQGMLIGILPDDGRQEMYGEGERNWRQHFDATVQAKIERRATEARLISFDLFDTLVLRAFLNPGGSRAYLAYQVQKVFGIENFADIRAEAEVQAHIRLGKDPHLADIYTAVGKLRADILDQLYRYELAHERRQLRPRKALTDLLQARAAAGTTQLLGVVDTYLGGDELLQVLPDEVSKSLARLYVSSDTGARKENRETWLRLSQEESVSPEHWLHVGDDEHTDILRVGLSGFKFHVHVLRPEALLSVVPALRSLRPGPAQNSRWEDQLWLGLLANRFTDISDRTPEFMANDLVINMPEDFGYTVLGPLIIDYLAWLARLALEHGSENLLFFSHEGYLLHSVYQRMRAAIPELGCVKGVYVPAAAGTGQEHADWPAGLVAYERRIATGILYSQDIRSQLSQLAEQSIGGAYFAVKSSVEPPATAGNWPVARFYDGRTASIPSAVMEFHSLLQSAFTSLKSELSIDADTECLQMPYRGGTEQAGRGVDVEGIHAGVLHFVEDVVAVTQADTLHLSFDHALVQEPLRCVGTKLWRLGSWAGYLDARQH